MNISGWISENLSDSDSGPESSVISDDESESGLFSLSEPHTADELIGENPSADERDPEILEMNFHLSEEEMKTHAHQIEKAKGLYRVSTLTHTNDS